MFLTLHDIEVGVDRSRRGGPHPSQAQTRSLKKLHAHCLLRLFERLPKQALDISRPVCDLCTTWQRLYSVQYSINRINYIIYSRLQLAYPAPLTCPQTGGGQDTQQKGLQNLRVASVARMGSQRESNQWHQSQSWQQWLTSDLPVAIDLPLAICGNLWRFCDSVTVQSEEVTLWHVSTKLAQDWYRTSLLWCKAVIQALKLLASLRGKPSCKTRKGNRTVWNSMHVKKLLVSNFFAALV
jgi:hypothetical protein